MIVKIINDNGDWFPRKGEVYKALPYPYDRDKVTLMYQVDPTTHKKLAKQYSDQVPFCNEYRENIKIINHQT